MKSKKNLVTFSVVFIFCLASSAFWFRIGTETSITITSISDTTETVGEKIKIEYRVNSGSDAFNLIVLPDTQYYSQLYPEIYLAQTQWIVENKDDLNIVFVSHVGDIVHNNDIDEGEWLAADAAMRLLDDVVPYSVLPGNHDMQVGGVANFYEQYFPASRFENQSWWGGSFDNNRYNYQLFSAGGDDYLIVHMQYCPTGEAMQWASDVLSEFPMRKAIVSTHGFLSGDASHLKYCQNKSNGKFTAAQMWNRLVKNNLNVFLVLSGHIPGFARREDLEGRFVYQLLSDYQDFPLGGSGYLRIMTFDPQTDIIRVTTYSPYLDKFLTDDDNQFDLSFDMTGDTPPKGSVLVYSGFNYCIGTVADGGCKLDAVNVDSLKVLYLGDTTHHGSSSSSLP